MGMKEASEWLDTINQAFRDNGTDLRIFARREISPTVAFHAEQHCTARKCIYKILVTST